MIQLGLFLLIFSQGSSLDFPNHLVPYEPSLAGSYELAIVRPVKRLGTDRREYADQHGKGDGVDVALDQVEVLDSTIPLPKTAILATPFRTYGGSPLPTSTNVKLVDITPSNNYLVVTAKPTSSTLIWPQLGIPRAEVGRPQVVVAELSPRKSDSEYIGLVALETKATKLIEQGAEPMKRYMANVANCLKGTGLRAVQKALQVLTQQRYKVLFSRGAPPRAFKVPPDAPCLAIMEQAYRDQSASNAARIACILSNWDVEGAPKLFYDAIKVAYLDPNLFYLADDPFPQGSIDYHEKRVHEDAAYQAENEAQFDLSLAAKSPGLRMYLMKKWGKIVDTERRRKALLIGESGTDPEDAIASMVLHRIAFWFDDQEHVPNRQTVNGRSIIVNKAELFKYWRTMLGMGSRAIPKAYTAF